MASAIGLRNDYSSADLRTLARRCGNADQVHRGTVPNVGVKGPWLGLAVNNWRH